MSEVGQIYRESIEKYRTQGEKAAFRDGFELANRPEDPRSKCSKCGNRGWYESGVCYVCEMTHPQNSDEREAFEARFGSRRLLRRNSEGEYELLTVERDWKVWQAARSHRPKVSLSACAKVALKDFDDNPAASPRTTAQAILNYLKQQGVMIDVTE